MDRYCIFDRNTGETLEYRLFNPYNRSELAELFEDWPYAAVDWVHIRD